MGSKKNIFSLCVFECTYVRVRKNKHALSRAHTRCYKRTSLTVLQSCHLVPSIVLDPHVCFRLLSILSAREELEGMYKIASMMVSDPYQQLSGYAWLALAESALKYNRNVEGKQGIVHERFEI